MATRTELIARLEELVAQEDVESASEAVEATKEAYEALVAAALQHERVEATAVAVEADGTEVPVAVEAGQAEPLPMESAPLQDEDDKRFKQLLDAFNQRVNDLRRKKDKEEADNLEA